MNIDLKKLSQWLSANKISLNADKTELILFKPKSCPQDLTTKLKINRHRLYPSTFIKYLGIYLDSNLSWSHQVDELSKKLRKATGALSKLRHFVPKPLLLSIYHAIFSSHLRYGCQIWGQRKTQITKRILLLQKSALRLITFSPSQSPSLPLFAELKILTIFDLVKYLNTLFVHQALNTKLPPQVCNTFNFTKPIHNLNTRGSSIGLLTQANVNTIHFGIWSLKFQCVKNWNFFQNHFKSIDLASVSPQKLKTLLYEYLINSYKST